MEFKDGRVLWDAAMESSDKVEALGVYESMNDSMAKLHLVNPNEIGLEDFGKPGNYVGRQVSRWSKQYRASETDDIEAMNNLIEWLPKNIPDDDETSIVHGDYRLDNMILNNNSLEEIASDLSKDISNSQLFTSSNYDFELT